MIMIVNIIDIPDVKENLRDVDTLHFCALSRSLDGMFTDDVSYLDKKVLMYVAIHRT